MVKVHSHILELISFNFPRYVYNGSGLDSEQTNNDISDSTFSHRIITSTLEKPPISGGQYLFSFVNICAFLLQCWNLQEWPC